MSVKDMMLAVCVVIIWGVNFVVIKIGLDDMPPFLLAALRFTMVAFPAIFFIRLPCVPLKWLFAYGMTISFGQFSFLFLAIKLGMPAGIASLVIQTQAFFTIIFVCCCSLNGLGGHISPEYWLHAVGFFCLRERV